MPAASDALTTLLPRRTSVRSWRFDGHHVIAWLVVGLSPGILASLVVRGTGLGVVRIIVGLMGAVISGLMLHPVTHGAHT